MENCRNATSSTDTFRATSSPAHCSIRPADRIIRLQEQAGIDRVGIARHECGAAFEAGDGILLDGQRMQIRAQPMRLLRPLSVAVKFCGKMRLPKSDMKHPADAVNDD